MHTKRGRVDQPPYCPFVVCLYSKTSPVYFPFPNYENQICFIKYDIQRRMEADRKKIDKSLTLGMSKKEKEALVKMLEKVLYNVSEP